MDQQEEEAKELPEINDERAIEIAGNIFCNLLDSFDGLDRVSIVQYGLDRCDPFCNDSEAGKALKNIYLDSQRNWQLYKIEEEKNDVEFGTRDEDIDELFEQSAKQPELFAKIKVNLEQMQLNSRI
jgi:hypothetical protein